MKKIVYTIVITLATTLSSLAGIDAYVSFLTFNSPEGPYIESSITAVGNSFVFKDLEDGTKQASMGVTMIFKKDGEIVKFEKYNIESQAIAKSDTLFPNFIDLQRIQLEVGIYNLELSIQDNNTDEEPVKHHDIIVVSFDEHVQFSGIQLLDSYKETAEENILSKNGYDLVPYNSDFYPMNLNKIAFYAEFYNTHKKFSEDEVFLVKYYIEDSQTELPLHDYNKFLRKKPAEFDALLGEFSIEKLPSGNYNIVVEVRDKDNKRVALNKKFFYRSNPLAKLNLKDINTIDVENTFVSSITSKDTMREYIKYLYPISNSQERLFATNQLKADDIELMQKFFYNFWYQKNMADPQGEWSRYLEEVKKVNASYGTQVTKGYETDRGRVYLQYGPPNDIVENRRDIGAAPFEIWHYYKIKTQTNVRFVFYDYMKIGNNYRLLHSDVVGEVQNYNWSYVIYGGNESDTMNPYIKDGTQSGQGRAGELFNQ